VHLLVGVLITFALLTISGSMFKLWGHSSSPLLNAKTSVICAAV